jgi:hypothetical protein
MNPLRARLVVCCYFAVSPGVSLALFRRSRIPFNGAFLPRAGRFQAIAALRKNELEKANGMEPIRVP